MVEEKAAFLVAFEVELGAGGDKAGGRASDPAAGSGPWIASGAVCAPALAAEPAGGEGGKGAETVGCDGSFAKYDTVAACWDSAGVVGHNRKQSVGRC